MRPLAAALLASLFAAAPACTAPAVTASNKTTYEANPAALLTGFWANYRHSGDVLRDFGPRPVERVNFHKWWQHETAPGVFDFSTAFNHERSAHLAGSTVITNVNTFFTYTLNPEGMTAMPKWVVQDITNPATRAAARVYLENFTRELLAQVGPCWLALDYEMLWFAKPITQKIRDDYRAWFLESAALVRQVAADAGMPGALKIGVIVNTDPFDTAGHSIGSPAKNHVPQSWLADCIAVADWVGFDTYAGGATRDLTPEPQLAAMRFWLEHYVPAEKPFLITESGFSTSRDHGDTATGYHIRGTEAEQASFFEKMFERLGAARRDPADPLHRVAGYLVWKYKDRHYLDPLENHFGLVRRDGSRKPAHATVATALRRIDRDPALAASRVAKVEPVALGQPLRLTRTTGQDYEALTFSVTGPAVLEIATDSPVVLLAELADGPLLSTHPEVATTHRLELPPGDLRVKLSITAPRYPVSTTLTSLTFP